MITRRQARKPYICTYSCGRWIKSGAMYLRHAVKTKNQAVPGTGTSCVKFETLRECSQCATGAGRAGLLEKK